MLACPPTTTCPFALTPLELVLIGVVVVAVIALVVAASLTPPAADDPDAAESADEDEDDEADLSYPVWFGPHTPDGPAWPTDRSQP